MIRSVPAQRWCVLLLVVAALLSGCAVSGVVDVTTREPASPTPSPSAMLPAATPTAATPTVTSTAVPTIATATRTTAPASATGTRSAATATPTPPRPSPTRTPRASATPPPADVSPGGPEGYLDDRSDPAAVMMSYVNAINQRQYARAYSYWEPEAAAGRLAPFADFVGGYADTASVDLSIGPIGSDAGAGQLYAGVPVLMRARLGSGANQTFAGCYTMHLSQPGIQGVAPFRPWAIQAATVRQAPAGSDGAALLAAACQGSGAPPARSPTPTADAGDISAQRYLDNRSSAVAVMRSFFNAINRKEYLRAYSYWESLSASNQLGSFEQFSQGYQATANVRLTPGVVRVGAAAGNLYYSLRTVVAATTTGGATQLFVGCYTMHLAQPGLQEQPPYMPMAIYSAEVRQVPAATNTAPLLQQPCQP